MSTPKPTGSNANNNSGKDNDQSATIARTAGFVVFSGIAMSILKALNPYNKTDNSLTSNNNSFQESTPTIEESVEPPSIPEPIIKKPIVASETSSLSSSTSTTTSLRTVEIVKGDTLWGLSRKHGVTIDAIKEANGLQGNTIYAGKKLVIP